MSEPAPTYTLEELAPKTDAERDASIHAVIEARKTQDAEAIADDLTQRERILIETAYDAGCATVISNINKTIGPAAVTLDAKTILNAATGRGCSATRMPPFGYDHELLSIVRSASKRLEYEGDPKT